MNTDIIFLILGAICILVGIAGSIVPALPGVALSYVGIVLLHCTSKVDYSITFLVIWGVIVAAITILDFYIPIWGTKKFGGSKKGVWGSTIGVFAGLFFAPWGIILGPFIGAVMGELIDGKDVNGAFKAGVGSFLGFISGILMNLIIAIVLAVVFVKDAWVFI